MLETRNTVIKLKNVLNMLISRLITVNKRNSEFKDVSKLPELEKKWTKDSNKKQVACGTTIKYVHTIGIQGEEKGKRTEEIFKI